MPSFSVTVLMLSALTTLLLLVVEGIGKVTLTLLAAECLVCGNSRDGLGDKVKVPTYDDDAIATTKMKNIFKLWFRVVRLLTIIFIYKFIFGFRSLISHLYILVLDKSKQKHFSHLFYSLSYNL